MADHIFKTTWVSELIGPELPARATATAEIGYKRRGYYFPTVCFICLI